MLSDAVEAVTAWVEQIVDTLGLPGVALIALFENLFPPTPSEFLYPLAGKLAADGVLTPLGVILAGIAGSLTGSLLYYALGRWLGAERARRAVARYGRLRVWRVTLTFVTVNEYDRAVELFHRWGGPVVLVARLIPVVHSAVSIPAGVVRMRLIPFIVYTVIGSALWIAPLTGFGMWLGENWEQILYWLDVYQYAWYAVIAVGVLVLIARRIRQHRMADHAAE